MSLNVKKIVKKISGLFREEEEPARVYTWLIESAKCPPCPFRQEERKWVDPRTPSVKLDSLYDQLEIVRRLEERIDVALKEGTAEIPIKRDCKHPKES